MHPDRLWGLVWICIWFVGIKCVACLQEKQVDGFFFDRFLFHVNHFEIFKTWDKECRRCPRHRPVETQFLNSFLDSCCWNLELSI